MTGKQKNASLQMCTAQRPSTNSKNQTKPHKTMYNTHNNNIVGVSANAAETTKIMPEIGAALRFTFYFYKTRAYNTKLKTFLLHTGTDFDSQTGEARGRTFSEAWLNYTAVNKAIKGFMREYSTILADCGYLSSSGQWSTLKASRIDVLNAFEKCGFLTTSTCVFIGSQECCVNICTREN